MAENSPIVPNIQLLQDIMQIEMNQLLAATDTLL
jgi:hypothetical protein